MPRLLSSPLSAVLLAALLANLVAPLGCTLFLVPREPTDLGPGEVGGTTVSGSDATRRLERYARIEVVGQPRLHRSDANGDFVVSALPEGEWSLRFDKDTDLDGTPELTEVRRVLMRRAFVGNLFGGEEQLVWVDLGDVELLGPGSIRGTVTDENGVPFAPGDLDGVSVIVTREVEQVIGALGSGAEEITHYQQGVERRVDLGGTGSPDFLLSGITPGTVQVLAVRDTGDRLTISSPVDVPVQAGLTRQIDSLRVSGEGALVTGVHVEVKPRPGAATASVRLVPSGLPPLSTEGLARSRVFDAPIDDAGRFELEQLQVGEIFDLYVEVDDLRGALFGQVLLTDDLTIVLGPAALGDDPCFPSAVVPPADERDCDVDGVRAVPAFPTDPATLLADCLDVCLEALAAEQRDEDVTATCVSGGVTYDCDDDLDGVADVAELACVGSPLADRNGDGLCNAGEVGEPVLPPPPDGGVPDGGEPDGGELDGGLEDAGPHDAGPGPVDGGADAGEPDAGPLQPPPGLPVAPVGAFEGLALGRDRSCAVSETGSVLCWGELGTSRTGTGRPLDVTEVSLLALGPDHACIHGRRSGQGTPEGLMCVGDNTFGQAGQTAGTPVNDFTEVPGTFFAVHRLAAGAMGTCALVELDDSGDVTLVCWGQFNTLLDGPTSVDVPVNGPAVDVAVGDGFACALDDTGAVFCFGDNTVGQCGQPTATPAVDAPTLVDVPAEGQVIGLSAGLDHVCATTDLGEVWCWGGNDSGQTGGAALGPQPGPGLVRTGVNVVAAGDRFTCALTDGGAGVTCWGANGAQQLGSAGTGPVSFAFDGTAYALAAGNEHACAVLDFGGVDRGVQCWGNNHVGQAGRGAATGTPDPDPVPPGPATLPKRVARYQPSGVANCLVADAWSIAPDAPGPEDLLVLDDATQSDCLFPGDPGTSVYGLYATSGYTGQIGVVGAGGGVTERALGLRQLLVLEPGTTLAELGPALVEVGEAGFPGAWVNVETTNLTLSALRVNEPVWVATDQGPSLLEVLTAPGASEIRLGAPSLPVTLSLLGGSGASTVGLGAIEGLAGAPVLSALVYGGPGVTLTGIGGPTSLELGTGIGIVVGPSLLDPPLGWTFGPDLSFLVAGEVELTSVDAQAGFVVDGESGGEIFLGDSAALTGPFEAGRVTAIFGNSSVGGSQSFLSPPIVGVTGGAALTWQVPGPTEVRQLSPSDGTLVVAPGVSLNAGGLVQGNAGVHVGGTGSLVVQGQLSVTGNDPFLVEAGGEVQVDSGGVLSVDTGGDPCAQIDGDIIVDGNLQAAPTCGFIVTGSLDLNGPATLPDVALAPGGYLASDANGVVSLDTLFVNDGGILNVVGEITLGSTPTFAGPTGNVFIDGSVTSDGFNLPPGIAVSGAGTLTLSGGQVGMPGGSFSGTVLVPTGGDVSVGASLGSGSPALSVETNARLTCSGVPVNVGAVNVAGRLELTGCELVAAGPTVVEPTSPGTFGLNGVLTTVNAGATFQGDYAVDGLASHRVLPGNPTGAVYVQALAGGTLNGAVDVEDIDFSTLPGQLLRVPGTLTVSRRESANGGNLGGGELLVGAGGSVLLVGAAGAFLEGLELQNGASFSGGRLLAVGNLRVQDGGAFTGPAGEVTVSRSFIVDPGGLFDVGTDLVLQPNGFPIDFTSSGITLASWALRAYGAADEVRFSSGTSFTVAGAFEVQSFPGAPARLTTDTGAGSWTVTPNGSRTLGPVLVERAVNPTAIPVYVDASSSVDAFSTANGWGPSCGNGIPEPGEECDDGNASPGDGCEATCLLSPLPQDCTWTGSASGALNLATNWSCGQVPSVNMIARFVGTAGSGYLNPPAPAVGAPLFFGALVFTPGTDVSLTIPSGLVVQADNLVVTSGSVTVAGILRARESAVIESTLRVVNGGQAAFYHDVTFGPGFIVEAGAEVTFQHNWSGPNVPDFARVVALQPPSSWQGTVYLGAGAGATQPAELRLVGLTDVGGQVIIDSGRSLTSPVTFSSDLQTELAADQLRFQGGGGPLLTVNARLDLKAHSYFSSVMGYTLDVYSSVVLDTTGFGDVDLVNGSYYGGVKVTGGDWLVYSPLGDTGYVASLTVRGTNTYLSADYTNPFSVWNLDDVIVESGTFEPGVQDLYVNNKILQTGGVLPLWRFASTPSYTATGGAVRLPTDFRVRDEVIIDPIVEVDHACGQVIADGEVEPLTVSADQQTLWRIDMGSGRDFYFGEGAELRLLGGLVGSGAALTGIYASGGVGGAPATVEVHGAVAVTGYGRHFDVINTGPGYVAAGGLSQGATSRWVIPATCGNGVVGADEECDDGNPFGDDGCSRACTIEPFWTCAGSPSICGTMTAVCGDGFVTGQEECDPGSFCSDGARCQTGADCQGPGQDGTCSVRDVPGCLADCTIDGFGYACEGCPSTCYFASGG